MRVRFFLGFDLGMDIERGDDGESEEIVPSGILGGVMWLASERPPLDGHHCRVHEPAET